MWQGDEIYLYAVIYASRTEYFQGTRDAKKVHPCTGTEAMYRPYGSYRE